MKKDGDREILKISGFGNSGFLEKTEITNKRKITPSAYSSPQVFTSTGDYTYKGDVWSLGVLFLEIITRKVSDLMPSDTSTFTALDISKCIEKTPDDQDLKNLIEILCLKMIVKEEAHRFSLAEVIDHPLLKNHYEKCKNENLQFIKQQEETEVICLKNLLILTLIMIVLSL